MGGVYETVIVPFDATQPGRAALGPVTDLAWRTGARVVIVNNAEVADASARSDLKSRAMSMSGGDVDFWVDVNRDLGEAVVEAARQRPNPLIAIAMKTKPGLRKRFSLTPVAEQVLRSAEVPVLVIGPNTEIDQGLPVSEVVASLDGSPASEQILGLAVAWSHSLNVPLTLVGVVAETSPGPHTGEIEYLEGHTADLRRYVPETSFELLSSSDPVTGLAAFMRTRPGAVLCMSTHGRTGGRGLIGNVALGVVGANPRPTVLARPGF
jgi:nucleotide-binding universal stress UspA family protein